MKKNKLAHGISYFATSALVLSLAVFSVNTYACDACKATKSEESTASTEKKVDAVSDQCKGDCKCKEAQAK